CHKEGLVSPPDDILDTPTGLGRTPTNRASRRTAAFQPARISGASRASGSAVAWEALRLRPGQATPAPRTASNPNRPLARTDTRICERGSTAAGRPASAEVGGGCRFVRWGDRPGATGGSA